MAVCKDITVSQSIYVCLQHVELKLEHNVSVSALGLCGAGLLPSTTSLTCITALQLSLSPRCLARSVAPDAEEGRACHHASTGLNSFKVTL